MFRSESRLQLESNGSKRKIVSPYRSRSYSSGVPVHSKISIRGKIPEGSEISLLTVYPEGAGFSTVFGYSYNDDSSYGDLYNLSTLEYPRVIIFKIYYLASGIQLKVINGALAGYYLTPLHKLQQDPVTLIPREEGSDVRPSMLYAGTRYTTRSTGNDFLYLVPMELKYYNFIKNGRLHELDPRYGALALWSNNPEGLSQEDQDLIANPTGVCISGNDWINANSSGCFFTSMTELEEGYYYKYCKSGNVCGSNCVGYCANGECRLTSRDSLYPYSCGIPVPLPNPVPPKEEKSSWMKYWWVFLIIGIIVLLIIVGVVFYVTRSTDEPVVVDHEVPSEM
jgi:hypothetical protein